MAKNIIGNLHANCTICIIQIHGDIWGGGVAGGFNSMLLSIVTVLVVVQFPRHNRCNMLAHDGFKTLTLSKLNCSRLIKQEQC